MSCKIYDSFTPDNDTVQGEMKPYIKVLEIVLDSLYLLKIMVLLILKKKYEKFK